MPEESRRQAATRLADDLLEDFELSRLPPEQLARKASRLARLLDDDEATQWLGYEIAGYPTSLDASARAAALRSNRWSHNAEDGSPRFFVEHLGAMQQRLDGVVGQLSQPDQPASGEWALALDGQRATRRGNLNATAVQIRSILERVVGSVHAYVAARQYELRFGAAVEDAFGTVRQEVDASIGQLVPDGMPMLASAFERATSANPEDRAGAAATCRRLLQAAADALRPPGEPVDNHPMGPGNYLNRLVDWIQNNIQSGTMQQHVVADLDYLGRRLDAADSGGQKGAHANVDAYEAARFVTGTYLLLGDILRGAGLGQSGETDAAT